MRNLAWVSLVLVAAFVAVAGVVGASGAAADVERPAPPPSVLHRSGVPGHAENVYVEEGPDLARVELADYLGEQVMGSWPSASIPAVNIPALAWDIAGAVLEKPSTEPWKDAVLLAGLAYFEGARFASYVDAGLCNDRAWRKTEVGVHLMHVGGDGDGGHAYTLWQIHPDGITVDGERVTAARLLADRQYAAGVALTIARMDPSLCGYTGEGRGDGWGGCPKADQRMAFVRREIDRHPYRP